MDIVSLMRTSKFGLSLGIFDIKMVSIIGVTVSQIVAPMGMP